MISNAWRLRIYVTGAAIVAIWLGNDIAQSEFFWPELIVGLLVALALSLLQPVPVGTLLLGCAAFGYIVGNRGFAQLSLSNQLPLLPAEFALMVGGGILLIQSAMRREVPVIRDGLNTVILIWIAVSSVRIIVDLRTYGVMALRDYATVYYAAFFFLAQRAGADEKQRRFLTGCLLAGFALLLMIYPLYEQFQDFFLGTLIFRGSPLIFFKGDLLGTFLAAGAVLYYIRFEQKGSRTALVLALLMAGAAMTTNNRASMLGLIVPVIILALGGRRRFLVILCGAAAASIIVMFVADRVRDVPWDRTALHGMYERAVSLTDPFGERTYSGEETSYKGDNNVFRSTWWRIVIDETVHTNPWLGMGWGNDLAEPFVKIYYPEGGDDFTVRSPHNIFITLFARSGLLGLVPFLGLAGIILVKTWRAARSGDVSMAPWCVVCTILTSATFGVVLEGPMGAVIFWTALGLANARKAIAGPATDPASPEKRCTSTGSDEWQVANDGALGSESATR